MKWVSEHIAGAARCFARNLPEPLIYTNVVWMLSRLLRLEIKDSSHRNRRFRKLITALVDPDEPRIYNYALLGLADPGVHEEAATGVWTVLVYVERLRTCESSDRNWR